jgi:hypothetical protein
LIKKSKHDPRAVSKLLFLALPAPFAAARSSLAFSLARVREETDFLRKAPKKQIHRKAHKSKSLLAPEKVIWILSLDKVLQICLGLESDQVNGSGSDPWSILNFIKTYTHSPSN